jgi:predicted peptidase
MKRFAGLLVCAFIAFSTPSVAETGFLDRSIVVSGKTFRYQIYVPSNYVASRRWPLILYLHGAASTGADGMRPTNDGFARVLRQNRERFEAIIVFAQAPEGTTWREPKSEDLALRELDRTAREFAVEAGQIYLIGWSMGGVGGYRILYDYPQRFAAAITVSARVEAANDAARAELDDIDRKAHAFVGQPDPFLALAGVIRGVPIWVFHGDADRTASVEQSRKVVAALKAVGADVRYTEMKGVGHPDAPEKAFADDEPMTWLLAHRRKAGTN